MENDARWLEVGRRESRVTQLSATVTNTSGQSACGDTVYFDWWLWKFRSLVAWPCCFGVCDKAGHSIRAGVAEQGSRLARVSKDEER